MADKFEVARALREIALLLEVDGANPFKVKAYERGARSVEALREDVTVLAREGRLTEFPGIGAALASTIAELATTGRSAQLEKLKSRLPAGVLELTPVLSLPKIKAVHDALGISTLAELKAAAEEGRLRTVPGFGEKTEAKVLAAIGGLAERSEETLLYEATREADERARAPARGARGGEGGGGRRAAPPVRDGDAHRDRRRREQARRRPRRTRWRSASSRTSSRRTPRAATVRIAAGITVNVEVVPPARFAAALHRSTGTAAHRAKLAVVAESRGLRLDDDGLIEGRAAPAPRHRGGPVPPPRAPVHPARDARGRGRGRGGGDGDAAGGSRHPRATSAVSSTATPRTRTASTASSRWPAGRRRWG